jgi:hypothetical protein
MHGVVNRELDAVYRATVQIAGDDLVQTLNRPGVRGPPMRG